MLLNTKVEENKISLFAHLHIFSLFINKHDKLCLNGTKLLASKPAEEIRCVFDDI